MNIGIGIRIGGSGGVNWAAYWATLVLATVENAAPTKVVMTFTEANTSLGAADFTIAGKTITLLERDVTNKILTLTVSVAFEYGDTPVITFVKTGTTANVTNNILYKMLLTSTGTGAGVSTLKMQVSSNITVTLGANAKFYTNSEGTTGETDTWTITSGALRTIYLKCATGTANMIFSDVTKITHFGTSFVNVGWVSGINAASLSFNVSQITNLLQIAITGTSVITGAMPAGVTLMYLEATGISWTYTGALPVGLTYLYLSSTPITWTYTGALPANITYLYLNGNGINWTYSGALPTGITDRLWLFGNNINWTYTGALPAVTGFIVLSGAGIIWTYAGAIPVGVTGQLIINSANTNWTGLDISGSGNLTVLTLTNYRIAKMSSADMVTLLTSLTNRVGNLPATITINDYADYASPPIEVTNAVATLKTTKSITTVNLGA